MPKKKIDYSNTIIYKIFCRDPSIKELYIGHTTNFVNRKYAHKISCKNCNSKLYTFIRENGGWDNWKILIIDDVECNNFEEARKVEQNYIDKYNSDLNTAIAFSIKDEDNKIKENKIKPKIVENKIKISNSDNKKYSCQSCYYFTSNKTDYDRHLLTKKHISVINNENNEEEIKKIICKCGKEYKSRQGLFQHKKKCDYNEKCIDIIDNNKISSEELITEQIKLIEELEIIKTKMQRICNLNINNNI